MIFRVWLRWLLIGGLCGALFHIFWHEGYGISWSLSGGGLLGVIPSHVLMFLVHVFLGSLFGVVFGVFRGSVE